jgi:hypothetical protein
VLHEGSISKLNVLKSAPGFQNLWGKKAKGKGFSATTVNSAGDAVTIHYIPPAKDANLYCLGKAREIPTHQGVGFCLLGDNDAGTCLKYV